MVKNEELSRKEIFIMRCSIFQSNPETANNPLPFLINSPFQPSLIFRRGLYLDSSKGIYSYIIFNSLKKFRTDPPFSIFWFHYKKVDNISVTWNFSSPHYCCSNETTIFNTIPEYLTFDKTLFSVTN